MERKYPIQIEDIENAKLKLANKGSYRPTVYPTKVVQRKSSGKSKKKIKNKRTVKPPLLPIVSLDEAIKRLNDDKTYAKVAKSMSWKDELD